MTRPLLALLVLLAAPAWAQLQLKFDVLRATYGAGSNVADVTERVRAKVANNGLAIQVTPEILGVDPAPNSTKTLTVEYRQGMFRRTARANDFDTLRIGNAPAAPVESLRITKAQYGDGRRMKDVTETLNTKIANARVELLVNNANLGGDPAPAVKKFLTVDYEYNGRPATAKINEGDTLRLPEGAVAATPAATPLRILSANYSAGRRGRSDVTSAVTSLIVNNALDFPVNSNTLGADPAPGTVKTLTLQYELNGQRQTASARDGESIRINSTAPAAVTASGLRVLNATYSAGTRGSTDVTSSVASLITANALDFTVNNNTLGADPAPGVIKTLTIEYELNGQRNAATARDGEPIRINSAAVASSGLRVLNATYSAGARGSRDVTSSVASLITANALNFPVNANTLGADPAPGSMKTLTVEYELNGRRQTATARDGETFRINSTAVPAVAVSSAPLRVVSASYGAALRGRVDVTSSVASLVTANALDFPVNANTLGADPAPGSMKTLTIEYEINGRRQTATARDGETLRINKSGPAAVATGALRILRASYSGGRRAAADVTAVVSSRVSGDMLELTVNGDTLGTDPAPGSMKTLTVEYEFNGQRQTVTARDAETLILPAVSSLTVVRATYGVPGRSIDATAAVAARVSGFRLEIPVNGETLGGDPAPGVVKTLTVEYDLNGRRRTATAQDAETLRIPGGGAIAAVLGKGPCLYRQPNYTGEAVCLSASQPLTNIANGQFRSLKMNGAAAVDVFQQPNYTGRGQSFTTDIPDLLQVPGAWWRYESAAPIQSARAR